MSGPDLTRFNRVVVLEGHDMESNLNDAIGKNGWVLIAATLDPYGRPVWMIGKEGWESASSFGQSDERE